MIINSCHVLSADVKAVIVEMDNERIVKEFDKRFQVLFKINDEIYMPKDKILLLDFESKSQQCPIVSEKTGEKILVPIETYLEKQLCDKSFEDCNTIMADYLHMNSMGIDLKDEILKDHTIINVPI